MNLKYYFENYSELIKDMKNKELIFNLDNLKIVSGLENIKSYSDIPVASGRWKFRIKELREIEFSEFKDKVLYDKDSKWRSFNKWYIENYVEEYLFLFYNKFKNNRILIKFCKRNLHLTYLSPILEVYNLTNTVNSSILTKLILNGNLEETFLKNYLTKVYKNISKSSCYKDNNKQAIFLMFSLLTRANNRNLQLYLINIKDNFYKIGCFIEGNYYRLKKFGIIKRIVKITFPLNTNIGALSELYLKIKFFNTKEFGNLDNTQEDDIINFLNLLEENKLDKQSILDKLLLEFNDYQNSKEYLLRRLEYITT